MGKKLTRAGMELRRAIRADVDANPAADHLEFRKKHKVSEGIVAAALTRTVAEWDAIIAATPAEVDEKPRSTPAATPPPPIPQAAKHEGTTASTITLGLEQGFVKFARKPAKMGEDYIFWIPRVYVKNGLVDPRCEYDVFLKKKA